jgi:hypothetical protein
MTKQEQGADSTMSKLVGALIEELAHEVPDDPRLEIVRADLLAASGAYESGKKKDVALRFYLAARALLQEMERLQAPKFKEAGTGAGDPARHNFEGNSTSHLS